MSEIILGVQYVKIIYSDWQNFKMMWKGEGERLALLLPGASLRGIGGA